jgi:Fe2+ or Zn2+ uptake regulation protein
MDNLVDLGRLKSKLEQERKAIDEKLHAITLVEQMLASETAQVETQVTSTLFSGKPIKEACVDVVNSSERYLTTADVLDLLLRGGVKFTTDRPVNTVAATLNRLAASGRIGSRKKGGRVSYFKKDRTQLLGRGGETDTNHQDINHAQRLESAPMLGIQHHRRRRFSRAKEQSFRAHTLQILTFSDDGMTPAEITEELRRAGRETTPKKVLSLLYRFIEDERVRKQESGKYVVVKNQEKLAETSNEHGLSGGTHVQWDRPIGLKETQERDHVGEEPHLIFQTE